MSGPPGYPAGYPQPTQGGYPQQYYRHPSPQQQQQRPPPPGIIGSPPQSRGYHPGMAAQYGYPQQAAQYSHPPQGAYAQQSSQQQPSMYPPQSIPGGRMGGTPSPQQPSPAYSQPQMPSPASARTGPAQVISKQGIEELAAEVDPSEVLDEDVKEALLQLSDDLIDRLIADSTRITKHRKGNTLEVRDVQMALQRNWNLWIPGFGGEEEPPAKKKASGGTDVHRQRMALIKKTLKKI